MTEILKQPYELLVRWDADGRISGAHVQWRHLLLEAGRTVGESLSPAEPVAAGLAGGFPLADILTPVQLAALAAAPAAT